MLESASEGEKIVKLIVIMKRYISEFIGTFSMIFCGTGAMTVNEVTGGEVTHVGIAITWGLIVMAMIYAFGETSGAHFNPAVTIAFAFAKKFSWKEVPLYIIAQILGAFAASLVLWYLFPASETSVSYTHLTLPTIYSV